ncbi:hypothetical protein ABVK25_002971 [Lepraria finkii]|uniref:Uncharacterized protein n=1 Tax=Lepraria finkii TaxID=1340010 RepID=A0ABR4BFF6_9LECA
MALCLVVFMCIQCVVSAPQVSPAPQISSAASDLSIEYTSTEDGVILAGPGFIYPGPSSTTSGFYYPSTIRIVPTETSSALSAITSSPSPSLTPTTFPSITEVSAGLTWNPASGSVGLRLLGSGVRPTSGSAGCTWNPSGSAGYTWNPSGSAALGLSGSAVASQRFIPGVATPLLSLSSSPGSISGPAVVAITQADGTVAEGPATVQTETSTAIPAMTRTIVLTESPVVMTTVTTSLLCTCGETGESVNSEGESMSKRNLKTVATTRDPVHPGMIHRGS